MSTQPLDAVRVVEGLRACKEVSSSLSGVFPGVLIDLMPLVDAEVCRQEQTLSMLGEHWVTCAYYSLQYLLETQT